MGASKQVSLFIAQDFSEGDSDYSQESLIESAEGRVVVDMARILSGDRSADLAVQDGDEIIVPRISEVVYVVGDVLEPGAYRHVQGTSVEQYIELAAGLTKTADKRGLYIIQPNGRVEKVDRNVSFWSFQK